MIDDIKNSGIGEFGNSRNLKFPKKFEFQNSEEIWEWNWEFFNCWILEILIEVIEFPNKKLMNSKGVSEFGNKGSMFSKEMI